VGFLSDSREDHTLLKKKFKKVYRAYGNLAFSVYNVGCLFEFIGPCLQLGIPLFHGGIRILWMVFVFFG